MADVSVTLLRRRPSPNEALAVKELQAECFGDVPSSSIEEDFIAQEFARILAFHGTEAVGTLALFKREVLFDGAVIRLGGLGGVCVRNSLRRQGVGTLMLKKAISVLREENCDIACLNVDLGKNVYEIYQKLGFRLMDRPISFENGKGEIVMDTGTMFIPICSEAIYDRIMHSTTTFHYGRGYW